MMLTTNRRPDWFFYPGWVASGAISLPIAWWIAWAIVSQIERIVGDTIIVDGQKHITEDFVGMYVLLPVLGLVMGALQYLLLRRYVPRTAWWIAATALGWVLPMGLLFVWAARSLPGLALDPVLSGAVAFSIIGASLGVCQWLVLRARVQHAAWWIFLSIFGWGLAGAISGETISSSTDVIALAFLPPLVACLAWWLLLGRLPSGEGSGHAVLTGA